MGTEAQVAAMVINQAATMKVLMMSDRVVGTAVTGGRENSGPGKS